MEKKAEDLEKYEKENLKKGPGGNPLRVSIMLQHTKKFI